jgi:hypothetical protein
LESNTLGSTFKIDYTAILESVADKALLHGNVISMCVDFDVGKALKALVKAEINDSTAVVFHGYPVDDRVGQIIQPRSFVNLAVGRVICISLK